MKQYLSSQMCLSCEGCCRFGEESSEWRAKAGSVEASRIQKSLPEGGGLSFLDNGYIKDKNCHGLFACVFFNPEDHTCGVYQDRPFECRLYPFVLTRVNGQESVSVHLECPFVQQTKDSHEYLEYISYLKMLFKDKQVQTLLSSNPFLFGDYANSQHELELVFHLRDLE